jgi:proteasome-associated ATPase
MAHRENEPDLPEQVERYEKQIHELQTQVKFLEDETALMRRRLTNSPRQVKVLEEQLLHARGELTRAMGQNDKLVSVLKAERERLEALKEEVEKLTRPPATFGVFLRENEDGSVDVFTAGRKMRVNVDPEAERSRLRKGVEVILNEALNVVEILDEDLTGEVVTIKELVGEDRAIVLGRGDEEAVALLSSRVRGSVRAGDPVLFDPRSGYALEHLPKEEVEEAILEEIPDITYEDIGGLGEQIEDIRDAVELPFLYAELFQEHQLKAPKGILLYGPPGCGKTMIGKAVANSLALRIQEMRGGEAKSYFLNVKGPELLNKYVGETEHKIREVFKRAREKASEDVPVVIFFDEMDSLFRMRGSGISSDMEATVVAQFLSEIDGVESLKNVIVIGASNRQDLIDPAVLRPGRLDLKVKVNRPDKQAAYEIFTKYLTTDLPFHAQAQEQYGSDRSKIVDGMLRDTLDRMYSTSDENKFLEVTYAKGEREIFYFKDFSSGAMIENIVARAKKMAVKRLIDHNERGIQLEDLQQAVRDEFKENEDLPNTTNPDDWARISGRKGERIINVRTLITGISRKERTIENIDSGQYL